MTSESNPPPTSPAAITHAVTELERELASAASGTTYTSGGTTYVGGANTLTVTGHDNVFTDSAISLQGRVYKDGTSPPAYAAVANGGTLSIPAGGGDGTWFVDSRGVTLLRDLARRQVSELNCSQFVSQQLKEATQ